MLLKTACCQKGMLGMTKVIVIWSRWAYIEHYVVCDRLTVVSLEMNNPFASKNFTDHKKQMSKEILILKVWKYCKRTFHVYKQTSRNIKGINLVCNNNVLAFILDQQRFNVYRLNTCLRGCHNWLLSWFVSSQVRLGFVWLFFLFVCLFCTLIHQVRCCSPLTFFRTAFANKSN